MFWKKLFTKFRNKNEYQHLKDKDKINKTAEIFKNNFTTI